MRKIVFPIAVLLVLTACGGKSDKKEGEQKETVTAPSDNPDYQKGLDLVSKNDCLTCHKIDEVLTGPSYSDVANKYAGTSDTVVGYLAGKIISGGKGVWGEVFMTPHAGLSQEDASAMAKYILLLKK